MVNRTILQGRLCADPELRRTQNGTAVCSFRVAWSETVKERETKLFLSCIAWQNTAEMVSKYFQKGKEIVVEGKLSNREYTDRDGVNRTVTELTVDMVHFCGKKETEYGGNDAHQTGKPQFEEIDENDGELPF